MRCGFVIEVSTAEDGRLEALVADRDSPQKRVWRALIVLLTVAGCGGSHEIMRRQSWRRTRDEVIPFYVLSAEARHVH